MGIFQQAEEIEIKLAEKYFPYFYNISSFHEGLQNFLSNLFFL